MRLYDVNDMVKADSHDCAGCFKCCQGMGDTVVLDPLDIYRLTTNLNRSFDELLGQELISLHVEEGLIRPHINMAGEQECCVFLNEEGRCSIHPFRPGLCRTFPLGRQYEEQAVRYFVLEEACPQKNKSKVKVGKWIGDDRKENQEFLVCWHGFLKEIREQILAGADAREINLQVLALFYQTPYERERDFYEQFGERIDRIKTEA